MREHTCVFAESYHEGADIYEVINKLPLDTNRILEFDKKFITLRKKYSKAFYGVLR